MSELTRKYNGLKAAHKELSVEVVALRSRIALAERVVGVGERLMKDPSNWTLLCELADALTAFDKGVGDADKD